jgi:hypothetical protein
VKVVVSEADEATISARELVIDIPEEDMLTVIQPDDDLVSFVILHAIRIRGSGTAREDCQKQDLGIREVFTEFINNGADTFSNLGARVGSRVWNGTYVLENATLLMK